MEVYESQNLDSLAEKMNSAHLQLSQPMSGENSVPDTEKVLGLTKGLLSPILLGSLKTSSLPISIPLQLSPCARQIVISTPVPIYIGCHFFAVSNYMQRRSFCQAIRTISLATIAYVSSPN